jgi:hypothetical protein
VELELSRQIHEIMPQSKKRKTVHHPVSPTMNELLLKRNCYQAVLYRIQSHPDEITKEVFHEALTQTHFLANTKPKIIDAILDVKIKELGLCFLSNLVEAWFHVDCDENKNSAYEVYSTILKHTFLRQREPNDFAGQLLHEVLSRFDKWYSAKTNVGTTDGQVHLTRIRPIVELFPKSLDQRNRSQELPLHVAMQCRDKHKIVPFLITEAIRHKVFDSEWIGGLCDGRKVGMEPIRYLSKGIGSREKSYQLIDFLFEESIQIDKETSRPLITPERISKYNLIHHAVLHENYEITAKYISLHPQGLSDRDKYGKLPIQLIFDERKDINSRNDDENALILKTLLRAGLEHHVGGPTGRGGLFVEPSVWTEILKERDSWDLLLSCMEFDAIVPHLLLNIAETQSSDVLREVILRKSECVSVYGDSGQLSLHLAAARLRDVKQLRTLLDANPSSISKREKSTGLLPFMRAACDSNLASIYELIRYCPESC